MYRLSGVIGIIMQRPGQVAYVDKLKLEQGLIDHPMNAFSQFKSNLIRDQFVFAECFGFRGSIVLSHLGPR